MDDQETHSSYRRSSFVVGDTMLPAPIISLLQAAFPGQPIGDFAATTGGFSNLTAIATIGAQRCVIKAATTALKRADVRREATLLRLLHASDLPIPRLLALVEDDEWTIAVTRLAGRRARPGRAGARPEQLEALYHALGLLLANIHRTPVAAPALAPQLEDRTRHALARLPALELESDLSAAAAGSVAAPNLARTAIRAGARRRRAAQPALGWPDHRAAGLGVGRLGHAAARPGLAVLDDPMAQVAARLWHSFLAGYDAGPALANGATPDELRALALGQIASILVRAHGQPSAWEEWQRRLRWTMELPSSAPGGIPTPPNGRRSSFLSQCNIIFILSLTSLLLPFLAIKYPYGVNQVST